jgi:predicted DNA-binding transcriptional regulator AlpA
MQPEILLEPDAVASAFGVSKRTLRRWWQAGDFPAPLRIGRRSIRWRLSDLQNFIARETPQDGTISRTTPERDAAAVRQ